MSGKKNKGRVKNKVVQEKDNDSASGQIQKANRSLSKNFFRENWRQLSVISLLAFVLYIQSVNFDYVLDDSILIVSNKFTQQGINGIDDIFKYESFKGAFGDQNEMVEGGRYRPLSIATFALEQSLTGGNKAISHFINVLLYVLTGILLFRVLLFMFPKKNQLQDKWFFSIPFVATMLFIAHPLHVEVVANIKGRDELIALLGEAGTLYYSFKYLEKNKFKYLVYSFLCFFLGILSKESVITFLAIIPLTVHFFTNAKTSDKVKLFLPALAGAMLYLIIRVSVIGHLSSGAEVTNLMNNPFYGMSYGEKTATIFHTLLLYLKLHIFPHPLTHDYYPYHIPIMNWSDWTPILSLVLHLAMFLIIVKGWKRKTTLAYSIAFYLVTLSIVSNLFISIGSFMNERFVYHASLGFCIAAAWLLVEKMNYTSFLKKISLAIFLLVVLAFSAKTLIKIPDWKSIASLDRAGIRDSPNSARSNYFYGIYIWNNVYMQLPANADPARRKAVLDSILPHYEKALRILPSYNSANAMWAGLAAEYHKLDHNYEKLIRVFETVNLTGTYEKFILEYLKYINKQVNNLKDAQLLSAFYSRMIAYYDIKFKNTTLPGEYRALKKEIGERMALIQ